MYSETEIKKIAKNGFEVNSVDETGQNMMTLFKKCYYKIMNGELVQATTPGSESVFFFVKLADNLIGMVKKKKGEFIAYQMVISV